MSGIKVTPEQLNALSGQIARGSGEIEGQLRALSNTVAPLVGGDWAGQAQQRFTALWDEWQRSAQGLKHALDGISQRFESKDFGWVVMAIKGRTSATSDNAIKSCGQTRISMDQARVDLVSPRSSSASSRTQAVPSRTTSNAAKT